MAQFTNQAQLSYNNIVTNSNIAVGEILEVLAITKTALNDSYMQNDTVAYLVSLLNSGATALNGLTLNDNLGAYEAGGEERIPLTYVADSVKYYVNGVLQPTPVVNAGPPLTVTGINIPAGGNAIIAYETRVNDLAPLAAGSTVNNTVTAAGAGITPIAANETVNVADEPILSITKAISPIPVAENGVLTYSFVISNVGNTQADATDNVVVSDVFDPLLTDVTVALNGVVLTEGTDYTYDETTGAFTTLPGVITVPAAVYTQDPVTGAYSVTPGTTMLTVSGTI